MDFNEQYEQKARVEAREKDIATSNRLPCYVMERAHFVW